MKSPILTFSLFLALSLFPRFILAAPSAPVTGTYYKADPSAENGYREIYRWKFNASDEWRRFAHFSTQGAVETEERANPFKSKPAEFIVLSMKDLNGFTGKDYFLSENGLMVSALSGKSSFYQDRHQFHAFLKEELLNHKGFESFPGEKFAHDRQGIIVRYNINEDLPNPSWLINKQKDVNLYDSFLRGLKTSEKLQKFNFDGIGYFHLLLNYPKAPGKFVAIGPNGIRISQTSSEDTFFKDEKNYFKFFRDMASDHMNMSKDVKEKDKLFTEQNQF